MKSAAKYSRRRAESTLREGTQGTTENDADEDSSTASEIAKLRRKLVDGTRLELATSALRTQADPSAILLVRLHSHLGRARKNPDARWSFLSTLADH